MGVYFYAYIQSNFLYTQIGQFLSSSNIIIRRLAADTLAQLCFSSFVKSKSKFGVMKSLLEKQNGTIFNNHKEFYRNYFVDREYNSLINLVWFEEIYKNLVSSFHETLVNQRKDSIESDHDKHFFFYLLSIAFDPTFVEVKRTTSCFFIQNLIDPIYLYGSSNLWKVIRHIYNTYPTIQFGEKYLYHVSHIINALLADCDISSSEIGFVHLLCSVINDENTFQPLGMLKKSFICNCKSCY